MIILHTGTLKNWGGEQNRTLIEATGLSNKGHRVIIACNRGSVLARKAKESGLPLYEVNMVKQAYVTTIPKLVHIIMKERVEIVATHSSVDSWAGGIAAKLTGRRLVRFRHNLYPIGRDPLTRFIYGIPDKIIAISNTVKDVIIGYGLGKKDIRVIPDAVGAGMFDPDPGDLREELKIDPDTVVIGNTSSFTGVKGQEDLLQAFNIINELDKQASYILLFACRMNELSKSRYLSYVREELRDKVVFLGHRDDVPRVLKTIDIFVFPSIVEGLGTALLEAMAMGKSVAVSDIPTFRDFIEDGVNGVFFSVRNPEDIAEKVLSIRKNDALKMRLGSSARATVLEKFALDTMLDRTAALYREVLDAAG